MCSHILVQSLNSKSFANESANHPGQYFSYRCIYLTWVIVRPAPSMLGGNKKVGPPTDRTSTLKGRDPRGPKVLNMSGSLLFISLLKGYPGAQQQQQRFFKRGGVPPRAAAAAPSPGGGSPPRYCSGQGASTLLQRLQQQLALLPGRGYPSPRLLQQRGGVPPRGEMLMLLLLRGRG